MTQDVIRAVLRVRLIGKEMEKLTTKTPQEIRDRLPGLLAELREVEHTIRMATS